MFQRYSFDKMHELFAHQLSDGNNEWPLFKEAVWLAKIKCYSWLYAVCFIMSENGLPQTLWKKK